MKKIQTSALAWLILIFLSLIWGSSFILIKKALIGLSPMHVAALRILVSFLAFSPFILSRLKFVKRHHWWPVIGVGVFGNMIPAFLYAIAQTRVLSATAGILNSLTPVFTLIVGVVIFRSRMKGHQIAGTVLGFLGASMLFANGFAISNLNRYTLLIVLATICYAISASLVQHRLSELRPLVIGATSFIFIGAFAIVYLIIDPIPDAGAALNAIGFVVLLSLSSTFFATIIFYRLVQMSDALFASSVSYIVPVVALMWGLVDGETLGWRHIVALVLVVAGVFLIRQKTRGTRTRT